LPPRDDVDAGAIAAGEATDVFDDEEDHRAEASRHAGLAPSVSTAYAQGTGRRLGISAAVVTIVLAAAFLLVHHVRARDEASLAAAAVARAAAAPAVDVVRVLDAPATRILSLPGETRAWYETTIYARVNGYVATWLVDIGDHVHQGQVLAKIDTPELDQQLLATRAELAAAQAEVRVKQADAAFAKTTYGRWRDAPEGVVSDQERDAKKAAYDSGTADLNAAESRVNLDQAKVDGLVALTQFKDVTAPFDGTITSRRVDVGDLVTAGQHRQHHAALYDGAIGPDPRVRRCSAGRRGRARARHHGADHRRRVPGPRLHGRRRAHGRFDRSPFAHHASRGGSAKPRFRPRARHVCHRAVRLEKQGAGRHPRERAALPLERAAGGGGRR
jgi:biotin carboxyl carrier protein